ncbi:hypothetical protein Nepgr_015071 [Nepenthes gracilis]|uniref:Uncharacterized protein n=1 Tax=Nepenthes gracilis TaxID=150966 RepID=A0AAD3XR37_NEPGR|nr:hypothetical protein Nepgr_015071 [Nepenthes gracilis]
MEKTCEKPDCYEVEAIENKANEDEAVESKADEDEEEKLRKHSSAAACQRRKKAESHLLLFLSLYSAKDVFK